MRKSNMYTSFMLGAAMMAAVSGTAMAADTKAVPQKKAAVTQSVENKKDLKDRKTEVKRSAVKTENKKEEAAVYGVIKKTEKASLEFDLAETVTDKKDADFVSASLQWKLDGKSVQIQIDKDTKVIKEKTTDTAEKTAAKTEKKENAKSVKGTALKNNKEVDKKNAADKKEAVKTDVQTENIKLEDLKEGMMIQVTVKKGTMTASEIKVLEGVEESKKTDASDKKENVKTDTKKAGAEKADPKKAETEKVKK